MATKVPGKNFGSKLAAIDHGRATDEKKEGIVTTTIEESVSSSNGAKNTVPLHNAIMNDTADYGPKSALSLLQEERSYSKLCLIEHPSFPLNLGLTELAGPAGSGKTQICLSVLVSFDFLWISNELIWKLILASFFRFLQV